MIPKLGAFFVHDDRSGGVGASGGKQRRRRQGGGEAGDGKEGFSDEEEEEEEDASVGRWRADTLPSTKNKTGSEQRYEGSENARHLFAEGHVEAAVVAAG